MIRYIYAALAFLLISSGCTNRKMYNAEQVIRLNNAITAQLDGRDYTIYVNQAQSGRSIDLNWGYYLRIEGDVVDSYLPYFGRGGFIVPYGGGEGLRFKYEYEDYSYQTDNNGNHSVTFNVRTNEDKYFFRVDVFTNGRSQILVVPTYKQLISFNGQMEV